MAGVEVKNFDQADEVNNNFKNAKCQMTWNTPGGTLQMFCWWKGTDPDAINKQLGQMNDFFEPHNFVECEDNVMDYNA